MRTYDKGRIPIPTQWRLTFTFLRLDDELLASALVITHQRTILGFCINYVRIFRINLRAKAITAGGHIPIRIHDSIDILCARRSTPGKIVLGSTAHVVEGEGIVQSNVIELHGRQVGFESPACEVVVSFSHPVVGSY